MPKNFKFHAIALASICLVVTLLYFMLGPKPDDKAEVAGDRYIRIVTASWGLNCNNEITRLKSLPVKLNPDGTRPVPLKLAMRDNVMPALSALCDGRLTCTTAVNSEVLKEDPLPSCFKQLQLGYRCFSIDREWKLTINQGELLNIDCKESADAARKA